MRRIEHHLGSLMMLPAGQRLSYVKSKKDKAVKAAKRYFRNRREAVLRTFYRQVERPLPGHLVETQNAIEEAQKNYHPQVYSGRVTLFRAKKQPDGIYPDATMGWGDLVAGGLEIHEAPGYHAAIIAEPRVQFTARILKECLSRAQSAEQEVEVRAYSAAS
jgi:aspartate racemase